MILLFTDKEIAILTELREKCKWEWTKQGCRNGYKVTSKTNGNSIFLPAAGLRFEGGVDYVGSFGIFWSSSLDTDDPNFAWSMYFDSGEVDRDGYNRFNGFSVRPVTE